MRKELYIKIVKLGLPILVSQLGMIVTGFADTTMVGHYSTRALASASFVNNLFMAAIMACVGFSYGITPLVGALFGQKRYSDIGAMMRVALIVNLCFALLVTAVMAYIYNHVDRLGQPEELLPVIRPYFLTFIAGIIPISIFNVFAQWSYAINRTKMPMWIILISNIINIGGNYALIYGHFGFGEMGLLGAGIATLVARWFCAVAIIVVFAFSRGLAEYRLGFKRRVSTPRNWFGQINRTSWPVSLQMTFETAAFTFSGVAAGWFGAVSLASYQIVMITGTLGFCVYYSMAAAVSVLVANASGTDDFRLMRRTAFAGYHIILVMAAAASALFLFSGHHLMALFTNDPVVEAAALAMIVPLVLYQFADATQITFANALRGTGHVMPMLWIAVVSYVAVGVPATLLLAYPAGLQTYGIVLSFSVSLICSATLFFYFFMRHSRK